MFNLGLLRRIFELNVIRELENTYQNINQLEHPDTYSGQFSNFDDSSRTRSFIKNFGFEEENNARKKQHIPSLYQRKHVQKDLEKRSRF